MPVYEYKCKKCGHHFERVESISEHRSKGVRCPNCQSTSVRQQLGGVHLQTSKKS